MKKIAYILLLISISTSGILSAKAKEKGLLWQISGKRIKNPTYLFGTIHLFDTSLYKLPQKVMERLGQVKKVYFELEFSDKTLAEQRRYAMVTDTMQQINKLMHPGALAKFNTAIKDHPATKKLGKAIYKFKPIFITPMLLTNGKTVTVDMEMYKLASASGVAVGGLETVAEQMKAIDAVPMTKQVKMMEAFLEDYRGPDPIIKKMTEAYVKQDVDRLLASLSDDGSADANLDKNVIVGRNIKMAERIDKIAGGQSTMFAVGAGHLGGPQGLIELLRKKGYVLKAVPITFTAAPSR